MPANGTKISQGPHILAASVGKLPFSPRIGNFPTEAARTCGPWLIFVPFAGMFAAFLIYDSNWRRPRKTELEGWMHLGLFAGFAMMFILMWAFCAKSAN